MSTRIHDDEPDTGEAVVRALLAAECPRWADRPLRYVDSSGTDNAMWRVAVDQGTDVVVRLPRRPGAAAQVEREADLLRHLADGPLSRSVAVPELLHLGRPNEVFPHRWTVLAWLEGTDAWSGRGGLTGPLEPLADDLGRLVLGLRDLGSDLPAPVRGPGTRGGPMVPLVEQMDRMLDQPRWRARDLLDVDRVRELAAEALVVDGPTGSSFVHGDLIPGNLLVQTGRLVAVLDWGGAGYGDPAQDLAPAWSVLDGPGRRRFRQVVDADDATWIRARAIELTHAVAGVLYYRPRNHALGDVMTATLDRILADARS